MPAQRLRLEHHVLPRGLLEVHPWRFLLTRGHPPTSACCCRGGTYGAESTRQTVRAALFRLERLGEGGAHLYAFVAIVGRVDVHWEVYLVETRLGLVAHSDDVGDAEGGRVGGGLVEELKEDELAVFGKGGLDEEVVLGHDGVVIFVEGCGGHGELMCWLLRSVEWVVLQFEMIQE